MHRIHRSVALAAAVSTAALGACLATTEPAAAQSVVPLPGDDRVLEGSPEFVYSVGTAAGETWETFGNVAQVSFDEEGNLLILDQGGGKVVVVTPSGRRLRQFGRRGGGPGEFLAPIGLTVAADGRVFVTDLGRRAFSVFSSDGEYLENIPFDRGWGMPDMEGLRAHPDGGIALALRPTPAGPGRTASGASSTLDTVPIVWKRPGADAVRLFAAPTSAPRVSRSGDANDMRVTMQPPPVFSPEPRWDVLPGGGVAVVHGAGYEVEISRSDGSVVRRLVRPIDPRRVTGRDRDRAREALRERMSSGEGMVRVTEENGRRTTSVGGGMPEAAIERTIDRMEFADVVPVIQSLVVAPDGTMWIERTGDVAYASGPIDLVSPDGTYRGTITGADVPDAFGPEGLAAYVEADEMGVERVVVRRLPEGWRVSGDAESAHRAPGRSG